VSTLKVTDIQHPSATDPAIELDAAGKLWLAGGKILQIVRATDSTNRTTTSTSFVDASLDVTITPQKDDSIIYLFASYRLEMKRTTSGTQLGGIVSIRDSDGNSIPGAQNVYQSVSNMPTMSTDAEIDVSSMMLAVSTPATTNPTLYKLQFRALGGNQSVVLRGAGQTTQLVAIEVSA
jgi:hypothetical protein